MSFQQLIQGGLSGILLGVVATLLVGGITVLVEKLIFHEGIAAAAISSVAGSAVANPQALADVDSSYAAIAPVATAQIAAAIIVTSFLTPWFTAQDAKHEKKNSQKGNGVILQHLFSILFCEILDTMNEQFIGQFDDAFQRYLFSICDPLTVHIVGAFRQKGIDDILLCLWQMCIRIMSGTVMLHESYR